MAETATVDVKGATGPFTRSPLFLTGFGPSFLYFVYLSGFYFLFPFLVFIYLFIPFSVVVVVVVVG